MIEQTASDTPQKNMELIKPKPILIKETKKGTDKKHVAVEIQKVKVVIKPDSVVNEKTTVGKDIPVTPVKQIEPINQANAGPKKQKEPVKWGAVFITLGVVLFIIALLAYAGWLEFVGMLLVAIAGATVATLAMLPLLLLEAAVASVGSTHN
ncbi:MAG TPA: hypothetical protein VD905_21265 [Flavobacteriales bacterium]|nr:hypothetical protein [Flavobacteriales bacterium]